MALLPWLPLPRQPLRRGDLGGSHFLGNDVPVLRGSFIAFHSCQVEPHMGLYIVLRNAGAIHVHDAKVVLGAGVALTGGLAVPEDGLGMALSR